MERIPKFDLMRPRTAIEAAGMLAAEPMARLLAGGTDLVPNLRRGIERPSVLVDLGAVRELTDIVFTDAGLSLGAGVTLSKLARDAVVARQYPAVTEAAGAIAGPGHRSVLRSGGNLCLDTRCVFYNQSAWWRAANAYCMKRGGDVCHVAPQGRHCHAAFCGDLAPVLLALRADVEVVSSRGTRRMALSDLYHDDGAAHLTIARDEVLARYSDPASAGGPIGLSQGARARCDRFSARRCRVRLGACRRPPRGVAHCPDGYQFAAAPARWHRGSAADVPPTTRRLPPSANWCRSRSARCVRR